MKKVLIVGGGGIGRRHIDAFINTGKCQVSVCEVDAEKLKNLKQNYPIASTFVDFYSIDISQFDAVVIATPANFHIKMAEKCCEVKIPFFLEKPLSVSLEGVDELVNSVEDKKIISAVGYTRRSMPSFRKLKELALSGIIGDIKMANFYCGQDYRKYRPDYLNIYFAKKEMGGGILRDFITHFVDLAQWIVGKPENGYAMTANLVFGDVIETDDSALVIGKFSGKLVNFYCNGFQKPNELVIDLAGTKGNLKYVLVTRNVSRIYFADDDSGNWKQIEEFYSEPLDGYILQAQNFLSLIDRKSVDLTTIREAAENLSFIISLIEKMEMT